MEWALLPAFGNSFAHKANSQSIEDTLKGLILIHLVRRECVVPIFAHALKHFQLLLFSR